MKNRLFKIVLSILVIVIAFSFVKVNAGEPEVLTLDGAQIRISEPAGLRFVGSVDVSFGEEAKYGFIISRGEYTLEQMQANLATSNAIFVDCGELDGENKFYLNVVNIATSYIEDDITVVACVDIAGEKTYAANAVTRNIKEVAEAAVLDPEYVANDFIDGIANTSTFFLDGGKFVTGSFEIGAYNAGNTGTSGITLCTKENQGKGSGLYWYKVSLKESPLNSHLFTVVETAVSGKTLDSTKDYDYVIAGAEANKVYMNKLIEEKKEYFYISDFAANTIVKTADAYELLLGNKCLVKEGDTLPLVEKDYCDFYGWYDNDLFDGDPIVTKSGNSSEEFYAKFDLHNYSIKYNLNGGLYDGASAIANDSYNINTPTFSLPEAALMSKVDYEFVEWNTKSDGSGTGLSEIVVGSYGDLELYAIWAPVAPVILELSVADENAINSYNPTKFVNTDFTAGKFTIGETTYTVGEGELFTSIASALSAASSNDIIYVFAGTYSDALIINKNNITLIGANVALELKHSDTFNEASGSNAIINNTISVSSTVQSLVMRGFLFKKQVTVEGAAGLTISNSVFSTGSTDGAINVTGACSNVVFDRIYQLGSGARFIYFKANVNNLSMTNSATLDAAAVNAASTNNYDFVRFGGSYESQGYGTIVFKNNYVRSSQAGFFFRNAKCNASTTSITIENNYFYKVPAAVYLGGGSYAPTSSTTVNYTIQYNTFIDCGSKASDWDVVVAAVGNSTNTQIHYNAFIDSFKTLTGAKTDYVIKVRSAVGTIDCSNNYFEGETGPITNVLNATNVSQLDTSNNEITGNAYEPYEIVEIDGTYYIYGVNLLDE